MQRVADVSGCCFARSLRYSDKIVPYSATKATIVAAMRKGEGASVEVIVDTSSKLAVVTRASIISRAMVFFI
jgi:hypothetical protein